MIDTLLDHVAGKFMLGEGEELRNDDGNNLAPILFHTVRDNVLDHVVSKLIHDKARHTIVKLVQDRLPRGRFAML